MINKSNSIKRKLILLSSAVILTCMSISANSALINSYDFNGDLSDTLGNGVDLTGVGSLAGGLYSFSNNQGLRLTSALPSTTDFAIEIGFSVTDSTAGYNKLIDFQDLNSDIGLYVQNGTITYYTIGSNAGSVVINTDYTLGLARSADTLEVFLDGVSLFSVADSGGQAVSASNILNFFEDDFNTSQLESFSGSADFIRIHNNASTFGTAPVVAAAVPEPGTLAILGLGLAGIGFARRKKI